MTRQTTTEEVDADDELLTSYLDQELTPEERSQLERRLVDDAALRERLAGMRRAWELLDEFPETPLNQHFTRSTLEMVALDIELEKGKVSSLFGLPLGWLPNVSNRTKAIACACLAILLGGFAGFVIREQRQKSEAAQLAIASVMPLLQDFPDLKGLEELRDSPQWKKLLELKEVRDHALTDFPESEDIQAVQHWIGRLDFHQKEILYNQNKGWERLNPSERRVLEKRHEALKNHPDSEELRAVAAAMYGVLESLAMNTCAEIRLLRGDQRIKAVSQEACYKLAMGYGEKLTNDEKIHLSRWAHVDLVNQLRESPAIPTSIQEAKLEQLFAWTLISSYSNSTFTLDAFADPEALTESLFKGLTPETIRLFQGVAPKYRMIVIANWVLSKNPDAVKKPSEDEMYERYKKLNDDVRDRLDMKRPEDAKVDMEGRAGRARRPGQDGAAGPGPMGLKGGLGGPGGPGGPSRLPLLRLDPIESGDRSSQSKDDRLEDRSPSTDSTSNEKSESPTSSPEESSPSEKPLPK
jgi:hypothetical protein